MHYIVKYSRGSFTTRKTMTALSIYRSKRVDAAQFGRDYGFMLSRDLEGSDEAKAGRGSFFYWPPGVFDTRLDR